MNLLDQRFERSGQLADLKARGIEIHARSLLLQGLLLMTPQQRPAYFAPWTERLNALQKEADHHGVSMLTLAMSVCHAFDSVDQWVIGCQNVQQLAELVDAYRQAESLTIDPERFACDDESLLLPFNWQLG